MKMIVNKKLALATLICSGLFSATSQAVNIDITGTVVASPCVVNGGNDSLEVNLGIIFRRTVYPLVAVLRLERIYPEADRLPGLNFQL